MGKGCRTETYCQGELKDSPRRPGLVHDAERLRVQISGEPQYSVAFAHRDGSIRPLSVLLRSSFDDGQNRPSRLDSERMVRVS